MPPAPARAESCAAREDKMGKKRLDVAAQRLILAAQFVDRRRAFGTVRTPASPMA